MRLIIVRHGETEENVAEITGGQTPGKLTKKGIEQSKKLAVRLKDEEIDCIYSSDLKRAEDTAKEIKKYHKETPLVLSKDLREASFGILEGKTKKEMGVKIGERPPKHICDTFESFESLFKRSKRILREAMSKHPEETVVFVSHTLIIKVLIAVIKGKNKDEIPFKEKHKNTSIFIFDIDDKGYSIETYNCLNHLD